MHDLYGYLNFVYENKFELMVVLKEKHEINNDL